MDLKSFISKINSTLDDFERSGREYELQKQAAFAEKFSSASDKFINGYGTDFHCSDEQFSRFLQALSIDKIGSVFSLDKKRFCMKIRSSKDIIKYIKLLCLVALALILLLGKFRVSTCIGSLLN